MSDISNPESLISELWVAQSPPGSPPAPYMGPYPDEATAEFAGMAQLIASTAWTAFEVVRTYRLDSTPNVPPPG